MHNVQNKIKINCGKKGKNMDTFKEQIIKKMPDKKDQTKKAFIILATVAVTILCFVFIGMFGIILAGCAVYGGYYLLTNLFVEYEYIVTGGEMDIDKIIGQRSRKRLATVKLSTAIEFGEAGKNLHIGENTTLIKADANNPEKKNYYIRLNHATLGATVVLFTPNEDILEMVKSSLPGSLRFGR